MPTKFIPHFTLSPKIVAHLMRIEALKELVIHLPLTVTVLASLRETARLYTTHYSTMIEGNRLTLEQIAIVVEQKGHFPGRERDENEVKGYYAALQHVEQLVVKKVLVTEKIIQTLHALVMSDGKIKVKPTSYRDGQNAIYDGVSKAIIYMPPESKDVPVLMSALVEWINNNHEIPYPIIAAIAHYQFATIHPYYDGNGRTARLLTTLILHLGGYDLKGIYSLEEYYACNLGAYYNAINIGESHNYYMGRAEADITKLIEYFIEGIAFSFENVLKRMQESQKKIIFDQSELLRTLSPKQRKVLTLFRESKIITSGQIGKLFGFKPRTSAQLCQKWVEDGFLTVVNSSNKGRTYTLSENYERLIKI